MRRGWTQEAYEKKMAETRALVEKMNATPFEEWNSIPEYRELVKREMEGWKRVRPDLWLHLNGYWTVKPLEAV